MTRKDILSEAERCVCGQRDQDYGSPENNFSTIANLWGDYKGVAFTPLDVAMMMALLKIARIRTGNATDDCFVDLAGYAARGGEIAGDESDFAKELKGAPNFGYGADGYLPKMTLVNVATDADRKFAGSGS